MIKYLHTGHAFARFNKSIEKIRAKTINKFPSTANYSTNIIHARYIQKLVTLTLFPYVRKSYKEFINFGELRSTDGLGLKEVAIDTDHGLRITIRQSLRSLVEYCYEWVLIFKSLVFRILNPFQSKISEGVVLVYGIGAESIKFQGGDERFVQFCLAGQITPLKESSYRIIQYSHGDLNNRQGFLYVEKPLLSLIEKAKFNFFEYFICLFRHMLNPLYFSFLIIRYPELVILGRDFACLEAVNLLTRKKLIKDVLITNSNYTDQYLWMRNSKKYGFQLHYVNYSQNNKPLVYKEDDFAANHPNILHIEVDVQWVWTEGYGEYLRSIGFEGTINVVGPILFYLPENLLIPKNEKLFRIALFDVTPIYEHVAGEIGLINNYYNGKTLIRFLSEVVNVCKRLSDDFGIKIEILLKHKRHFNKNHDIAYIELCNKMHDNGIIKIIDYHENMFDLICSSDLTISIPLTSSAYVSTSLGVPSIYFDADCVLGKMFDTHPLLEMCSGELELIEAIKSNLISWRDRSLK